MNPTQNGVHAHTASNKPRKIATVLKATKSFHSVRKAHF